MPNCTQFSNYKNDFILGKSSPKSDIFDVIVFACRYIVDPVIPSFITRIAPYAFNNCDRIKEVEFQDYSQLQIIDEFAFYESSIKIISIPKHLKRINKEAFSGCEDLFFFLNS